MVAVVIGGVPLDCGIAGADEVDACTSGARGRATRVADMIVRQANAVRAGHINAAVSGTRNGEARNDDITFG